MTWLNSPKKLLFVILVLAFIVRIIGINYGLPLWLVGDEPPFTTAALKMLELKTVLPVLHKEEFRPTLYFPPYLAYIYLIPFTLLLGLKYLLFSGSLLAFKNYIASDLTSFFIIARIINVILGTLTVWLVYKISKNIFKKEPLALLSATFLAFSTLHIYFSFVARDWLPAVFLFTLVMFFLTHTDMSFKKRYMLGAVMSGVAFGISLIAAFSMLFMLFWYLCYEKHSIFDVLKEKILYVCLFVFLVLSAISIAVYPYGFHLSSGNSIKAIKSLYGLAVSVSQFFKPQLYSEPVLMIFALVGLIFSYRKARNFFWTILIYILSYVSIFYLVFHYEQRFTIYLFPIIAILAGYGLYSTIQPAPNRIFVACFILILLIPLATSLRLDWLVLKNDSRIQVRKWAESNLQPNTKIMVYADMARFASNKEAIKEQQALDPASLRQIDYAEMSFAENPHGYTNFHALNLYSVNNDDFYKNITNYAKINNYKYLFLDPTFPQGDSARADQLKALTKNSVLVKSFGSTQTEYDLREGHFGNPLDLFKLESLGPEIDAYKLNSI